MALVTSRLTIVECMVSMIVDLLYDKKMTQAELAQRSFTSTKHVSLVLSGKANASTDLLEHWAQILGKRFCVDWAPESDAKCLHCGRSMGWWLDKAIDGEIWYCQWCRKESKLLKETNSAS